MDCNTQYEEKSLENTIRDAQCVSKGGGLSSLGAKGGVPPL